MSFTRIEDTPLNQEGEQARTIAAEGAHKGWHWSVTLAVVLMSSGLVASFSALCLSARDVLDLVYAQNIDAVPGPYVGIKNTEVRHVRVDPDEGAWQEISFVAPKMVGCTLEQVGLRFYRGGQYATWLTADYEVRDGIIYVRLPKGTAPDLGYGAGSSATVYPAVRVRSTLDGTYYERYGERSFWITIR